MKQIIKAYLDLAKIRITTLSTASCITGYIIGAGVIDRGIIAPTLGIFLLACSACTLNHIQDRNIDARMNRTQTRPLPLGIISLQAAWIYTIILFLAGSFILYRGANAIALALGLIALVWYNGIYAALKRVTSLAVIPGSIIGAIPPLVGWAATGQPLSDPRIIIFSFLLFIWQIPHFWLLLIRYKKDYEESGLPTLTRIFSLPQLGRIIFIWTVATALIGLLLPLYNEVYHPLVSGSLVIMAVWLIFTCSNLLIPSRVTFAFRNAFRNINIFILLVMIVLVLERLLYFTPAHQLTVFLER